MDRMLGGRYRLDEQIGRGGMATVWRGYDTRLRRRVAVKVLEPAVFADDGMRERFVREAQTVAGLAHPNIVAVFDVAVERDAAYVVMELIDGPSVATMLRSGPLPAGRAIDVATQVCAALAGAHAEGVVHRDITPANLLVTPAGVVKVCDFGIASYQRLAYPSLVAGTRFYMPPEQEAGGPVDARTDLFGLGCVLYAMLTGNAPVADRAQSDLLAMGVPPGLATLVGSLMARDPRDRPESAARVAAMLSAAHRSDGVPSVPTSMSGTAVIGAPTAVGGPAVVGTAGLPPSATQLLPQTSQFVPDRPGNDRWLRPVAWGGGAVALLIAVLVGASWLSGGTEQAADVPPGRAGAATEVSPTPSAPDGPVGLLVTLTGQIDQLVQSGELTPGKAKDLRKLVEDISRRLAEGDADKAAEKVDDLAGKLADLRDDGKLTESGYESLTALLNQLSAVVGGGSDG